MARMERVGSVDDPVSRPGGEFPAQPVGGSHLTAANSSIGRWSLSSAPRGDGGGHPGKEIHPFIRGLQVFKMRLKRSGNGVYTHCISFLHSTVP